jgi:hypothetical protein
MVQGMLGGPMAQEILKYNAYYLLYDSISCIIVSPVS